MSNELPLFSADAAGAYTNPIMYVDLSDPDAISDNGVFYLVTPSFNYVPGLPIWKSFDLVHWELINHAIKGLSGSFYDTPKHSCGVWAPSIRKYRDLYYIYFGMPDDGIFCVTATDPEGEWSAPQLVMKGKGLIDPCPYFSEEGNYLVHAYAKSRCGFNSRLAVVKLSDDGRTAVSEDTVILDDPVNEPTIEGPKVYERNGYVYIFAPAGGVDNGWQTVLRGTSVYGPFEKAHILSQQDTPINGPHQGALVNAGGKDWFLHFQATPAHGRILHLQPVVWANDMPLAGDCGKPVLKHALPLPEKTAEVLSGKSPLYPDGSDDFKGALNLLWQAPSNINSRFYETGNGRLKLYTTPAKASLFEKSEMLTQPLLSPDYRISVTLGVSGLNEGDLAGLAILGSSYRGLGVLKNAEGLKLCELTDGRQTELLLLPADTKVIRLVLFGDCHGAFNIIALSADEASVLYAKDAAATTLPYSLLGHHWVGSRVCLFADAKSPQTPQGYAEFTDFKTCS